MNEKWDKYALTIPRAAAVLGIASIVGIAIWCPGDGPERSKLKSRPQSIASTATSAPAPALAPAPAPAPARIAAIPPKPQARATKVTTTEAAETPEQTTASGTAYNPNVKLAWTFSTIRGHSMLDGTWSDIPFADVRSGDTAKFEMRCGPTRYVCASGDVALPRGPLDGFRVVAVMHETTIVYPIRASMTRSSWRRAGPVPEWERVINAEGVLPLGRAREQVGVRTWDGRLDSEVIVDDVIRRRRTVRP